MTNKEKFLQLVSKPKTDTLARNTERIKNREMLRESQGIALKVLLKLDDLKWSQRDLAREMGVSPQQITKIVSGKENLTLSTQKKLQTILDIPVLASYYESKEKEGNFELSFNGSYRYAKNKIISTDNYDKQTKDSIVIDMKYAGASGMYSFEKIAQ